MGGYTTGQGEDFFALSSCPVGSPKSDKLSGACKLVCAIGMGFLDRFAANVLTILFPGMVGSGWFG